MGSEASSDKFKPLGQATLPILNSEFRVPESAKERPYVLVFAGEKVFMYQLPRHGEVIIGRGDDVQLALDDGAVSRRHAKIVVTDTETTLTDLGSSNGTAVNGERVVGVRSLVSGDVVTLCGTTLVFHSRLTRPGLQPVLDFASFRRRAEEELERSLRFRRECTIQCVAIAGAVDRPRVSNALASNLRFLDLVTWDGADRLLVLMPETGAAEAPRAAERLLEVLGPTTKVGFATCPSDGCDVDTLLASSRAATTAAAPGGATPAAQTYRRVELGERTLLVADPAMTRLYSLLERLASSDLPILICGETGTGKELAALAVHHWSRRRAASLVTVNCAAIPENLVESELFGHDKGAFTGATAAKVGLFEAASGGTVFLDELGELPLAVQAKLLRVLETKKISRVGDVRVRDVDIRVVAATNRKLEDEVAQGRFRQDLYFRLSGATVWIPPLRDRSREISLLSQDMLADAARRAGRTPMQLALGALQCLARYDWPGNVRELRNVIDYLAATVPEATVEEWHVADKLGIDARIAAPIPVTPMGFRPIEEEVRDLEIKRMNEALAAANGNQTKAADLIAMPLRTFQAKVRQYGLRKKT